jgi:glucose-1-phosphate adenylyltransferase
MKGVLGIISTNYSSDAFGHLTDSRTAASLPLGGRYRLVDFPLTNMVSSDISTVGLITPFYYRSIMDHVGNGQPWGLAKRRGGLFVMPGTVYGERENQCRFVLKDLIRNRRLIDRSSATYVLLCDASKVMRMSYDPFCRAHASSGHKATFLYSKADHRFLDCIVMDKAYLIELLDAYGKSDNMDLTEILVKEAAANPIGEYEYDGYVGIVDNLKDYVKVNMDLLNTDIGLELLPGLKTKVQDAPPTLYRENSDVSNSVISSGCIIKGTLENSVVARNVVIEEGAVVRNSIIMQRYRVGKGARIENAVLDKYVNISEGVIIKGSEELPFVVEKNAAL